MCLAFHYRRYQERGLRSPQRSTTGRIDIVGNVASPSKCWQVIAADKKTREQSGRCCQLAPARFTGFQVVVSQVNGIRLARQASCAVLRLSICQCPQLENVCPIVSCIRLDAVRLAIGSGTNRRCVCLQTSWHPRFRLFSEFLHSHCMPVFKRIPLFVVWLVIP